MNYNKILNGLKLLIYTAGGMAALLFIVSLALYVNNQSKLNEGIYSFFIALNFWIVFLGLQEIVKWVKKKSQ